MNVRFTTADRLPLTVLTQLWNLGFSDYYVSMHLSEQRLSRLIVKECISLADSFIPLVDDEPAGLVLTGICYESGKGIGFDGGTAILPRFRRRGVGRLLMERFVNHLQSIGISQAHLAVVQRNRTAIRLYEQVGFRIMRSVECYEASLVTPRTRGRLDGLHLMTVSAQSVSYMTAHCYRRQPEWQNQVWGRKLGATQAVAATLQGELVGYALYLPNNPILLLQLGVLPAYRGQGIGSQLLEAVLMRSEGRGCNYLNHPEEEVEAAAFLVNRGFTPFLEQFEMTADFEPTWSPRLAETADIPKLTGVLEQAGLPVAGLRENIASFWLMETEGRLLGVIGAELYQSVALLRSLWVEAEARGGGLGSKLVAHIERVLRSQGIDQVFLLTTSAEMFFERLDYRSVKRSDVPAELLASSQLRGACPLTAAVMYKDL